MLAAQFGIGQKARPNIFDFTFFAAEVNMPAARCDDRPHGEMALVEFAQVGLKCFMSLAVDDKQVAAGRAARVWAESASGSTVSTWAKVWRRTIHRTPVHASSS